ncbi:MAG TPA: sulfur carrier protein ThiS [Rhizobacter sp.]
MHELQVTLNGTPKPWAPGLSLAALLEPLEGQVATALNGQFVPQAARQQTLLSPGDQVTVFRAIVGG